MTMNDIKEIADFCFPWSLVKVNENVLTVDDYSISQTKIEVDGIGGVRHVNGYIVIHENAPDETVVYEGISIQKAFKEVAKALAEHTINRAFEIYDPCMVVNPNSL